MKLRHWNRQNDGLKISKIRKRFSNFHQLPTTWPCRRRRDNFPVENYGAPPLLGMCRVSVRTRRAMFREGFADPQHEKDHLN
jgi:hypothetical protein